MIRKKINVNKIQKYVTFDNIKESKRQRGRPLKGWNASSPERVIALIPSKLNAEYFQGNILGETGRRKVNKEPVAKPQEENCVNERSHIRLANGKEEKSGRGAPKSEGKVWKVLEGEACVSLLGREQGQGGSGKSYQWKERWTKGAQITRNKTAGKYEQDPSKANGNQKIVPSSVEFTSQGCGRSFKSV